MATKLDKAVAELTEQRRWFDERGGTPASYLAKYGEYGNGGLAIYRADLEALTKAGQKVLALIPC